MTVCLQVLNFLSWFLVFCSSLWLPPLGGEKALTSMTSLPLASLVLEPLRWTVKAPVIFYQLGPPLTCRTWSLGRLGLWQCGDRLKAWGHLTALFSAHRGSALGLFWVVSLAPSCMNGIAPGCYTVWALVHLFQYKGLQEFSALF